MFTKPSNVLKLKWRENILLFDRSAVQHISVSFAFTKLSLALYLQCYSCKTKCSRKKTARSAGCPCISADKKCSLRCGYGQKLQCKNGKNDATERENAQRLPGNEFDRHTAEIQQSEEEIKVNNAVD